MKNKSIALLMSLYSITVCGAEAQSTTFHFVRHGRTAYNIEGRIQGQADIPLDTVGIAQARDLACTVATRHFDLCVSSDLCRAIMTATIIMQEHHNPIPIIADARLRERSAQGWEGKFFHEFHAASAEKQATVETDEQVYARMLPCLEEYAAQHPAKDILVVTHGGIICGILSKITGRQFSLQNHGIVQNGAFLSTRFSQGSWSLVAMEGIKLPSE
jgi:broad specificity phosphatase PhoE